MVDDCRAEQKALREVFPEVNVLLCTFHVLQSVKRWLNNTSHKIEKEQKTVLQKLFSLLLYANTEKELHIRLNLLKSLCAFDLRLNVNNQSIGQLIELIAISSKNV